MGKISGHLNNFKNDRKVWKKYFEKSGTFRKQKAKYFSKSASLPVQHGPCYIEKRVSNMMIMRFVAFPRCVSLSRDYEQVARMASGQEFNRFQHS